LEERYKLQCVAGQRRNNAASCNAPGHRCSVVRSCSVAPSPAIAATAAKLYTSDVGLSSDIRPTFVRRTSMQRPACIIVDVIVLHLACVTANIIVTRPACVIVDVIALRPVGVIHMMSCRLAVQPL